MIGESLVIEFQEAVKKDYGKNIGIEEATRILSDFVGYFNKLAEINYRNITDKKTKMELSTKARKDLRKVLIKDIGPKATEKINDDDLNKIGGLFLNILAEYLKMKLLSLIKTETY